MPTTNGRVEVDKKVVWNLNVNVVWTVLNWCLSSSVWCKVHFPKAFPIKFFNTFFDTTVDMIHWDLARQVLQTSINVCFWTKHSFAKSDFVPEGGLHLLSPFADWHRVPLSRQDWYNHRRCYTQEVTLFIFLHGLIWQEHPLSFAIGPALSYFLHSWVGPPFKAWPCLRQYYSVHPR